MQGAQDWERQPGGGEDGLQADMSWKEAVTIGRLFFSVLANSQE